MSGAGPATRDGSNRPVVLSAEETAAVRQALVTCLRILRRARDHSPQAGQLLADLTRDHAAGRSPGGMLYDIGLAIDYLDFAPAARSSR